MLNYVYVFIRNIFEATFFGLALSLIFIKSI